jgi:hypothetical protein
MRKDSLLKGLVILLKYLLIKIDETFFQKFEISLNVIQKNQSIMLTLCFPPFNHQKYNSLTNSNMNVWIDVTFKLYFWFLVKTFSNRTPFSLNLKVGFLIANITDFVFVV